MATILTVDDSIVKRHFLVELLKEAHHRVLEASDGAEALAVVRAEQPDLIVSDILMPTMDGYEFVHRLRDDPAIAGTPVIFSTAHYHQQEAENLARACGVSHILTKPCEPEEILRTVNCVLGTTVVDASCTADEFQRQHRRLLTDKLSQQSIELQQSNERLQALIELGLQLGSERELPKLLDRFCRSSRKIIGARYAIAGIVEDDRQSLRYHSTSGMDSATVDRLGAPNPRCGGIATVLSEARSLRLSNPTGDPTALNFPERYPSIHAWLGAPIISPGRVYGWFGLIDKVGAEMFSEEDERLATILAAQVGRIYENGRLYADALGQAAQLSQEIAERKQAEESARHSRARKEAILRVCPDAIVTMDHEGNVCGFNQAAVRIFGYEEAAVLGKPLAELIIPSAVRSLHQQGLARYLATGDSDIFEKRLEMQAMRSDGSEFSAELTVIPIPVDGPPMFTGYVRDITERKLLEDQFRHAQKMEAVGRLAGGVAHDFNNLMTVITGYSELALAELHPGDPLHEYLDQILRAGERAAGLTRQLLAFSRKQVLVPVPLDLNDLLQEMEKMLRRLIGADIDFLVQPHLPLWFIKADPGQIEQVVMNIVINARDAMPHGGKLTIETDNVKLDNAYVGLHSGCQPGQYVLLAISDTGCGMDADTKARIFEPFFSTKGNRGTGLGLATVYGIVKQSGGNIEVYSEPGIGTSFKIYLPRDQEPARKRRSSPILKMPTRRSETILLAEDEPGVRALAKIVLEHHGYTVLEAQHGGEALHLREQYRGKIDLLVTDVVMPLLSGRQLSEQLAHLQPDLKVLFLSGYTDDAIVHHGVLESDSSFLQKPFSPDALARKVREVLDQPKGGG